MENQKELQSIKDLHEGILSDIRALELRREEARKLIKRLCGEHFIVYRPADPTKPVSLAMIKEDGFKVHFINPDDDSLCEGVLYGIDSVEGGDGATVTVGVYDRASEDFEDELVTVSIDCVMNVEMLLSFAGRFFAASAEEWENVRK